MLIKLIAPHQCLVCGTEGDVICATCLPSAASQKAETCFRCNAISAGWRTCGRCRRSTRLAGVVVASHYENTVKEAITLLKYQRRRAAAAALAAMITPLLKVDFDVITSVPPATSRLRQRGFDHGALIAKQVAAALQPPYQPLLRRTSNIQQVGKTREQRLRQADGVFAYTKPISGLRVLIIDDVLTTGATLAACAAQLKKAGAKTVWGAAAAKH